MKSAFLLTLSLISLTPLANATVVEDSVPYCGWNNGALHNGELQMRMWYPDGVKQLRGILVMAAGLGGDARSGANEAAGDLFFKAVAKKHNFALMGLRFSTGNAFDSNDRTLVEGIHKMSATSEHPELQSAPIATYGFSNGSGWAVHMAGIESSRTIAFAHDKGISYPQIQQYGMVSGDARNVPGLIVWGEQDTGRAPAIKKAFAADRSAGALWQVIPDYGQGHSASGYGHYYAALFLDRMIDLRLPEDWTPGTQPELISLTEDEGWLGDNSTTESPLAAVHAPNSTLPLATKRTMSWFATEELSWLWRAIATRQHNLPAKGPSVPGATFRGIFTMFANRPVTLQGDANTVWYTANSDDSFTPVPKNPDGASSRFVPNTPGIYPLWAIQVTDALNMTSAISPLTILLVKEPIPLSLRVAACVTVSNNIVAKLQVRASNDCPLSELTYTWSPVGEPPAPVGFSINGNNTANDTSVTFKKAGNYQFKVTLRDAGGQELESVTSTKVSQIQKSLTMTPLTPSIPAGGSVLFSVNGIDQFGDKMKPSATTWSVSGGGSIDAKTGSFTAGSKPGTFRVTAADSGKSATTLITVVKR